MEDNSFTGTLPKDVDRYLLIIRWGLIFATGLIYAMTKPNISSYVNPLVALLGISAYSIPISIYEFENHPITRGNPWWLLLGDTVFSLVAVALTGGHLSAFFLLFLLVIIEAALAYRWRLAMVIVVLVDSLQLAASAVGSANAATPFLVVNRFVALLVFGIFAILFGENARREEAERRRMVIASTHERNLNQIFLKLGESSMDLERMLRVVLGSAQSFLGASYAMVLLRDESSTLSVAASSAPHYPVGRKFSSLDWLAGSDQIFVAERGEPGWPDFIKNEAVRQVIGVRLLSPTREPIGWIVVGRERAESLPVFSRNLIRALALEAGFAVHNARLYKREQEHIRKLEKFNDARSTFFSALGHELKTPLTVLKTLVSSLDRLPELPEETRREIVESIQVNLDRLESLVSDMLESARLEANAVEIYPVMLDLRQRVKKTVASVRPVFARKDVVVKVKIPGAPVMVRADPRRADQILLNLLSNAAKFAPGGSEVWVGVSLSGGQYVTVCVEDAGPGVPPEDRERIFDKFYIVSENRALAGVGLGLFISKELVQLHGGRIWVEDSDLGGSRFCFTLPTAGEAVGYEKSHGGGR